MLKKLFADERTNGREDDNVLINAIFSSNGLTMTQGQHWKETRGFVAHCLKEMGKLNGSIETVICREVKNFLPIIEAHIGKSITDTKFFDCPSINIIWGLLSGEDLNLDTAHALKVHNAAKELIRLLDIYNNIFA